VDQMIQALLSRFQSTLQFCDRSAASTGANLTTPFRSVMCNGQIAKLSGGAAGSRGLWGTKMKAHPQRAQISTNKATVTSSTPFSRWCICVFKVLTFKKILAGHLCGRRCLLVLLLHGIFPTSIKHRTFIYNQTSLIKTWKMRANSIPAILIFIGKATKRWVFCWANDKYSKHAILFRRRKIILLSTFRNPPILIYLLNIDH
jgi:hypothetical protein